MKLKSILLLCALLLLFGCRDSDPQPEPQTVVAEVQKVQLQLKGCRACHPGITHDALHNFSCTKCHDGDTDATDQDGAHTGLIARPAHPDFMAEKCGSCHPDQIDESHEALHFTLRNAVNLTRNHFGADDPLDDLTQTPQSPSPTTKTELVDDMLRRRCLRCHLYTGGDEYPYTQRGTGCAACHLKFIDGKLESHEIIKTPGDYQCLSCHYGNHVGADYYGQYENDYNWEYRTPYTTSEPFFRPYGVELLNLAPDIHQQRGMVCLDCHAEHGNETAGSEKLSCSSCHRAADEQRKDLPGNIHTENGQLMLTSVSSGKKHPVPQLRHPAHKEFGRIVACQACHGQWGFNDATTHLMRSDLDDYDPWERLTVQSSSEVEKLLEHNLYSEEDEYPPTMRDSISGETAEGVWYKGFTQRRWENIIIRRDSDGIIKVFRPILDLRLSYVDSDENLLFDSIGGNGPVLLPYTPHTTGPAGLFYKNRFADILKNTNKTPLPVTR